MIKNVLPKSLDETYSEYCFLIEKELGCSINPHYPAVKFVQEMKELEKYYKEMKKAQKK